MPHILHDISVWWWARSHGHADASKSTFAITWPLSIRRIRPTYHRAWLITFQRPQLHFLNTYEVEIAYVLAHRDPSPIK